MSWSDLDLAGAFVLGAVVGTFATIKIVDIVSRREDRRRDGSR